MTRSRLRDLGITMGRWPTGTHNAITDVPDVLVGHTTLIYDNFGDNGRWVNGELSVVN